MTEQNTPLRDDILASISLLAAFIMLFGAINFFDRGDYSYCTLAVLHLIVFTITSLVLIAKMLKNKSL